MIKSWKPVVGFSCIILLLTAVLLYTYDNISRLKKELNNRKTYDGEITLINRLLLRTDEYYSQSNKLVFHNDPEIYETLAQQSDSIDLSFGTLKSISRNKPYASLVDSVSLLYTELHRNMDTLVQFAQTNDFSFDAPLLKFVSEVADSLRKDERSTQFTTVQSTTIIVEKPVLVEVSNKKKNRKNKKNAVEEADTLKPSVTNYHQTDTVIRDSTFSSKVGNSLQKIGTEIGRLKTKTSKKQQEMAMRYAGLDAVKNVLFERINSLLQRIRQAEQEQLNARLSQATEEADHTFSSLVVLFIAASFLAVIFVVLIIYDIARSNYYRNKLETEKLRAEKLAKDKENFLATMSHEIRTPLNAITGFAYLLKEMPLTKETEDYIRQINRSAVHLRSLVNQTLDYTKLENGNAESRPAEFDFVSTLMEVIGPAEGLAHEKNLTLHHLLQPMPFQLYGDVTWLRQIVYNLVGNAVKYTSSGSVTVSGTWREEGGKIRVEIRVTDTGPGIPKELQPLLFLAYKQLPTASSSGSTGLGLAITAKMTELLNGNITVDSEPGKGTTFCVTIPYEKGKTQPVAVPDKPVPPDLTGEHFLLVDDDESSLLLLRLLLQRWKATITLARSVAEAGTHIEEGEFSFVVMDWNLGDGRGDSLLQKFSPQRKNPPIIISSGDDALKTVVASFTHLQIHFVPKPIDPDDLAAGIDAQKNARK